MTEEQEAIVRAAWADYRLLDGNKFVYTTKEVAKRHGWRHSSNMYDYFTQLGLNERRFGKRCTFRRGRVQLPPCPGVNTYCHHCYLADMRAVNCKDWRDCAKCDRKSTCPCWQPKPEKWTKLFEAWEKRAEAREKRQRRAEGHYAETRRLLKKRAETHAAAYNKGDTCCICGTPVSNGKDLCKPHAMAVKGLRYGARLTREEAVEVVREREGWR